MKAANKGIAVVVNNEIEEDRLISIMDRELDCSTQLSQRLTTFASVMREFGTAPGFPTEDLKTVVSGLISDLSLSLKCLNSATEKYRTVCMQSEL